MDVQQNDGTLGQATGVRAGEGESWERLGDCVVCFTWVMVMRLQFLEAYMLQVNMDTNAIYSKTLAALRFSNVLW